MKWVSKKLIIIVLLVLVLAGGGAGAYLYIRSKNSIPLTAEEEEAKLQAESAAKQAAEEARIQKLVDNTDTVEEVVALPEQDKSIVGSKAAQKLASSGQHAAALAIIDELIKANDNDAIEAARSGYRLADTTEAKEYYKQKAIELLVNQGIIGGAGELPADYFDVVEAGG